MDPRGDETGARDGFFYPESTVARTAAKTRRPPRRAGGGSRLPWLLCALLLALMAAGGVWVVEPLRRQLARAKAGQEAAVAGVLRLQAERQASLVAAPPAPPVGAPVDDNAAWAEARRHALEAALTTDLAAGSLKLQVVGGRVVLHVTGAALYEGSATEQVQRLFAAVGRALAADESPYRLVLFVSTSSPEAAAPTAVPAPRHASHRRGRRGRHTTPPAPASSTTSEQRAAEAAAKLLASLRAGLAERGKSAVEGAFGTSASDGADDAFQLRLERAVP